jgi:hypothetical protein
MTYEKKYAPSQDPSVDGPVADELIVGEADLKDSALETLGMYMLATTYKSNAQGQGPENKYHPNPTEVGVSDSSINDRKSIGDTTPENEPQSFFHNISILPDSDAVHPGGVDPRGYFQTLSDGGDPNTRAGGTFNAQEIIRIIDKAGGTPYANAKDGHEVLAQVLGDAWDDTFGPAVQNQGDNNPVREGVSQVLKSNRFMPQDPNRQPPPFDPIGTIPQPNNPYILNRQYSNGMYSLQRKVGRYDAQASKVAMAEIAKVGAALMLQGAGAPPNQTDPSLGNAKTRQMGTGIPHKISGYKLNVNNIMAKNVKGAPIPLENNNMDLIQKGIVWNSEDGLARKPRVDGDNVETYGHLNSHLEPFGGALPTSMILLSVMSAVVLAAVGAIFTGIITLIYLAADSKADISTPEPYPLGARKGQSNFGDSSIGEMILEFLRIPTLKAGSNYFFTFLYGLLSFYFRITDLSSASYFLIINRVAIRDSLQIGEAMGDLSGGDLIGGIEGLFTILEAFATSTTIQFVNTVTVLGDITLMSGDAAFGNGSMVFSPYGSVGRQPDFTRPSIAQIHLKSRTLTTTDEPDYRLAWRFGSLPSKYLLPINIVTANLALGRVNSIAAVNNTSKGLLLTGEEISKFGRSAPDSVLSRLAFSERTRTTERIGVVPSSTTSSTENKQFARNTIGSALRQEIEDQLDSYYMPFYFHDTRTDEIVALHAFIESLSDSFSPQYSDISGFGRMDPIKIYKSTSRSMSISFYMVATNPDDLSELYYSINKLVTMVYPQWSKGSTMKSKTPESSFTQPFSQMPTASPLIRLRVGELWSSNYSTNTLSRLFGLGSDNFEIPDEDRQTAPPYPGAITYDEANAKIAEISSMVYDRMRSWGHPPSPASAVTANSEALITGTASGDRGIPIGTKVFIKPSLYPQVTLVANIPEPGNNPQNYLLQSNFGKVSGTVKAYHIAGNFVGGFLNDLDLSSRSPTYNRQENRVRYVVELDTSETFLVCGQYDLEVDIKTLSARMYSQVFNGKEDVAAVRNENNTDWERINSMAQSFFNSENNSIVRAFESSGGKGIAGHITNLDFDWNLAPWDERPGSRAPTYCKVSVSFAPIHDIPLGLDHEGGIRAPAYNVGDLVRNIFGQGNLSSDLRQMTSAPPPTSDPLSPTGRPRGDFNVSSDTTQIA